MNEHTARGDGGRTTLSAPGEAEIVMTRSFDAPRELVWRLWTDPELIPEFWGPRRLTTTVERFDFRRGGGWRFVSHDADGTDHGFGGEFREVVAPERITWTFVYDGAPDEVVVETMELTERNGVTTMIATSRFSTPEGRDAMLRSGMESGAAEMNERFAELLARTPAEPPAPRPR